ncbi:MAG: carboxypeptidase-like regulatory domain-containing protein [Planctomycetaceae bacterium]|jgi:hypothetical protein|nr:carboxypeptidase-like regulatory domain-containing protein [Planctomycetaceae bacterium]
MKRFYFLVLCFLLFCGCGQGKRVGGTVKYEDGTPLTTGIVTFIKMPYQWIGTINTDGSYEMYELKPGDGVPPGTYQVTVSSSTGGSEPEIPVIHLVDPKFNDIETSGLTCEVKGNTIFNITVTKPVKK